MKQIQENRKRFLRELCKQSTAKRGGGVYYRYFNKRKNQELCLCPKGVMSEIFAVNVDQILYWCEVDRVYNQDSSRHADDHELLRKVDITGRQWNEMETYYEGWIDDNAHTLKETAIWLSNLEGWPSMEEINE